MKALAAAVFMMACTPPSRLDSRDRARDAGASGDANVGDAIADASHAALPPAPEPVATVTLAQPHLPPTTAIAAAPGAIMAIAAVDDGGTAVTSDGGSTLRLWPTLDGTREPVVLAVTIAPEQLAIVRDGHDVVIAAADRTGQLELLRTTELGALASRVRLDLGQRIAVLVAADHAFVMLRDDQTLVAIDRDARVIGTLAGKPGEHLATLVSRHGRVLAMLQTERGALARWLTVGATFAFGETSPAMAIDPQRIALAPGGKRIAAFARSHKGLAILDIASGKVLTWVVPLSDEELVDPFVSGFVDDKNLLFGSRFHKMAWWSGEGTIESDLPTAVAAACDHQIVVAGAGGLDLAAPDRAQALGYVHASIRSAAPDGNGWLVTNGTSVFRVDDRFRARQAVALSHAVAPNPWHEVIAIDARHVVAQSDDGVFVLDLADDHHTKKLAAKGYWLRYEPSTGMLGFNTDPGDAVAVRDPKTGELGEPVALDDIAYAQGLKLLDPAVAGGKVAVVLYANADGGVRITDVRLGMHDGEVEISQQSRDHGPIANVGQLSPEMFARLGYAPPVRRANHDRSLIAEVGAGRLTLRDAAGKVRWTTAPLGMTDAAWSALGDLVVFGSGMARVDVETGALVDRQCGWQFGLTEIDATLETGGLLCEAP